MPPTTSLISSIYQLHRCIPFTHGLVACWVLTVGCTRPSISLWFYVFIMKITPPSLPDPTSAWPCLHHQRLQLILSTVCYAHGLSWSSHIPSLLCDGLACPHSAPATLPSDLQVYHRAFALVPWLAMIFLSMWLTHLSTRLLGSISLVAILHYFME